MHYPCTVRFCDVTRWAKMFFLLAALLSSWCCFVIDGQITHKTKFSCVGRPTGYYADIETGCQVYHMCDGLGRQFSYSCPNATLFQQRMLICDHWYMVNCSKSESDFSANLLIGQKGIPFVDDDDKRYSYHRTPRPDLLSKSSMPDYNFASRTSKSFSVERGFNIVGVDSDDDQNNGSNKSKPSYMLPSHWSIHYEQPSEVESAPENNRRQSNNDQNRAATSVVDLPKVANFDSNFKATTPVYPQTVDSKFLLPSGEEIGLLPPISEEEKQNFKSDYANTTPNYPKHVDPGVLLPPGEDLGLLPPLAPQEINEELSRTTESVPVNFGSNFTATTPNYPTALDPNQQFPSGEEIGILPPVSEAQNEAPGQISPDDGIPTKDDSLKEPSKYYEPPKFIPDHTNVGGPDSSENPEDRWAKLRAQFFIPEYDFPLETVSRPGYEGGINSFLANITAFSQSS